MPYDNTCVWNLSYDTKNILTKQDRLSDVGTDLGLPRGEEGKEVLNILSLEFTDAND